VFYDDDDDDDDWLYKSEEPVVLPLLGVGLEKMGGFFHNNSRHIYVDHVTKIGMKRDI
jgi:hypothetical protein